MGETAELLGRFAPSVEAEVKPRLNGFLGGLLRAYLPLTWVFRTEHDAASLVVEATGHVVVSAGALASPDVTVEGPYAELSAMLERRGKQRPTAGQLKVTPHTAKGRTAFDYMRSRLGL